MDWFLKQHPEFSLVTVQGFDWFESGLPEWIAHNPELSKTYRLWPHRIKGEGHFIAVFEREVNRRAGIPSFVL